MQTVSEYNPDFMAWSFFEVHECGQKRPREINFTAGFFKGEQKNKFLENAISGKIQGHYIPTSLFKKSLIDKNSLSMPEDMVIQEDFCFVVSYLMYSDSIYLLPQSRFYNYFQNEVSVSKTYSDKYLKSLLVLPNHILKLISGNISLEQAFARRMPYSIFYALPLITQAQMPFDGKLKEVQKIALDANICQLLGKLKLRDFASIKAFSSLLIYQGFYSAALIYAAILNKAYIVSKKIKRRETFLI